MRRSGAAARVAGWGLSVLQTVPVREVYSFVDFRLMLRDLLLRQHSTSMHQEQLPLAAAAAVAVAVAVAVALKKLGCCRKVTLLVMMIIRTILTTAVSVIGMTVAMVA